MVLNYAPVKIFFFCLKTVNGKNGKVRGGTCCIMLLNFTDTVLRTSPKQD